MKLITISEAAQQLGRKPWDVQRLIDAGSLPTVVLVDAQSIADLKRDAS